MAILAQCGCNVKDQHPVSNVADKETAHQEIWGSTVILSVKGQQRAKVKAVHILKFEERHLVQMDGGITVDFYDANGRHVSVLTAHRGEVDNTSQDLMAAESVIVNADSGSRLETERLKWQNATQKIVSDTLVTITRGEEHIVGMGFESDADLEHWKIKESVTGLMKRRLTTGEDTTRRQ
jgi:LPS export ABC transporter protein LptC